MERHPTPNSAAPRNSPSSQASLYTQAADNRIEGRLCLQHDPNGDACLFEYRARRTLCLKPAAFATQP